MGGQTSGGPARTTDSSIGEPNRPQTPFTTASQPASQRGEMPGAERTRHPGGSGRARAYGPSATGRPQDPQR
jgi:hypothetical protein